MKNLLKFSCLVLICGALASCGYTTASLLPSHLKTIHVQDFENKVPYGTEGKRSLYFPLLEVEITEAVIDRYLFDGNLRIAKEDNADLILKGALLDYERQPLRYFDDQDVQEYRINVVVSLELWDAVREETRWSESRFVGTTTYFLEGALAKSESAAMEDAIVDLARRIVERTVEDW